MSFTKWNPPVADDCNGLEMIANVIKLRQGPGRDFLFYGKMRRPAEIVNIPKMRWNYQGEDREIYAVFHSAWQSADNREAIVLANWTTQPQTINVRDKNLPESQSEQTTVIYHHSTDRAVASSPLAGMTREREITIAPLSCVMIEITTVS